MTINVALLNGVKQISWDPLTRMTTVYLKNGQVDYYFGVAWSDFSAIASSPVPLAQVTTSLAKYKKASGAHG